MTTTKKLVIAVVALSMALVIAIGGTLAFLVAQSNTVTNTFTYGNIALTLAETKGEEKDGVREFGKVVPGATIEKDPTVTVTANSENCYVYVKIENNVVLNGNVIVECNIDEEVWIPVGSTTNDDDKSTITLYRYHEKVANSANDTVLDKVFETVTFGDFTSADVSGLDAIADDIVITAYAHQSDNTSMDVADNAAKVWAGITTTP